MGSVMSDASPGIVGPTPTPVLVRSCFNVRILPESEINNIKKNISN